MKRIHAANCTWLLLSYSLPAEPSSARVRVWRKLKRLGAVACLESNWMLPDLPRFREMITWLAAEITEAGGKAVLWSCASLTQGQDESLRSQFMDLVDPGYEALLKRLADEEDKVEEIAREYLRLRQLDHFASPKGALLKARLSEMRIGKAAPEEASES